MATPHPHQIATESEYRHAVETLHAEGETIPLRGVKSATVAAHVGVDRSTAAKHLRKLVESGDLERVRGLTEYGPQDSYRPTGGEGRD